MTHQQRVDAVYSMIERLTRQSGLEPKELTDEQKAMPIDDLTGNQVKKHILWMCYQILNFEEQGREAKVFRWLGFVQGAVWLCGYASIDDLKELNK